MNVTVIYSTEAFIHRNEGRPGNQTVCSFNSLEEAKNAPLPKGYVTAYINQEDGVYVYSSKLGWEFHSKIDGLGQSDLGVPGPRN